MKTSSCKAKGRRLQDWVRDQLIKIGLNPDDIKCAIMGESGADVRLFGDAKKAFPYNVECKNVERVNIWEAYNQATTHGDGQPLVIIKRNHHKPLAVIEADHFFELVNQNRK